MLADGAFRIHSPAMLERLTFPCANISLSRVFRAQPQLGADDLITSLRQKSGCGNVRLHGTFDGNMINNDKQKIIKSSKVNQLQAEGTYPIGNRHVVVCI